MKGFCQTHRRANGPSTGCATFVRGQSSHSCLWMMSFGTLEKVSFDVKRVHPCGKGQGPLDGAVNICVFVFILIL